MPIPSVTVFIGGMPKKLTPLKDCSGFAYAAAVDALSDEAKDAIADEADFLRSGKHGLFVTMRNLSQVITLDSEETISQVLMVLGNELGHGYFDGSYKHI